MLTAATVAVIWSPENSMTMVPGALPGSTRRISVGVMIGAGRGPLYTLIGKTRVAAGAGCRAVVASGASRGTPSNIGTPMM